VAVLLVAAGWWAFAQSAENVRGSLSGRLTDLHSRTLEGVALVLRNQATGVEAHTITAKNGVYRFTELASGTYTLAAESPLLGHGELEEIEVNAGHETRVQTAMEFAPEPPKTELAGAIPRKNPVEMKVPLDSAPLVRGIIPSPPLGGNPHSEARKAPPPVEGRISKVRETKAEQETKPKPESKAAEPVSVHPVVAVSQVTEPKPVPPSSGAAASTNTAIAAAQPALHPDTKSSADSDTKPLAKLGTTLPVKPVATQLAKPATSLLVKPATILPPTPEVMPVASPVQSVSARSTPAAQSITSTLSEKELQALPIPGRRWQDFVQDNAPASVTPAGGQGPISIGGSGRQAEVAVDGVSRELGFGSTNNSGQASGGRGGLGQSEDPAGMAQVGAGGHGFALSEVAIREVQSAANGVEARASGGRINAETEHGGDTLHGQGFVFDRQNAWGAKNPFTQWIKETAPAVLNYDPSGSQLSVPIFGNGLNGKPESYTPGDRETTFGIGLGDRIRRKKLFWFAALDGLSRDDAGVSTVKHPYLCEHSNANGQCTYAAGFFEQPTADQLNVLCAQLDLTLPGESACSNGLVQGLVAYSSMLETLAGLLGPAARTAMQGTGFTRLDWQLAERYRLTLEGIGADWNSPGGGLTRVEETYGNHSFGSSEANEEWLLGRWEAFVTPNLLSVTQFSLGHALQQARPATPSTYEKTLLAGNAWGQLPEIVVDNRYGFTIGNPSRFGKGSYPDERLYQLRQTVDWVRGKLLVKAGFDIDHSFDATSLLRNQTGTYTYSKVENFVTDALVFSNYGLGDALDPDNQHNCDETGKVWRDSAGGLRGLGYLPCYAYYSQTIGPADWHLSTNDWAGYATAQWQAAKMLVVSGGLRWEREQLPPPISALWPPPIAPNSPPGTLPTKGLPSLGNNWGPRVSVTVGTGEHHWPLLRLGYGMFFERTENAALQTALTQTGSPKGDLSFFMRPTDNLNAGGAPPFPYVLQGEPTTAVKPGAVEFAPNFRQSEVHQAVASIEERLPNHVELTASAMVSLGRRLPISIDTNLDTPTAAQSITYNVCDQTATGSACAFTGAGPIKTPQITVPFYADWPTPAGVLGRPNPGYQQIAQIMSRANSTYEAGVVRISRYGRRGLSLHAHYTYSHAMDWNPNESSQVAGNDVLDQAHFNLEYGTSNLDMRHSAGAMAIYEPHWKLRGWAGKLGNGWMAAGVGQFHSGLPYTMRTSGSLAEEFDVTSGEAIVGLGPGINGSGGDNRIYGVGTGGIVYNFGRNTFRYPSTWKADMRLGKRIELGHMRELELLAESFNLLNHQNVTELETTGYFIETGSASSPPTLNYLTGLKASTTAFGQPLNVNATNFYREREIQLGLRLRF
jgi:hypothetical protein